MNKEYIMGSILGKKAPPAPPPDAPTVMPASASVPQAVATAQAPPPVMPLPDDKSIADARRRKLAKDMGRSGRMSTILSQDASDKLG